MSPIKVIQKAICCPSGNCYAIEYNANYPQRHKRPCMTPMGESEARAILLALSQMEPTPGMVEAGLHLWWHDYSTQENWLKDSFKTMLAAAVKEKENG
jgi:hypothetical protein